MYQMMVETEFSAAHRLRDYPGPCSRLHGHNFKVQVYLVGEELDNQEMLIDFRAVKQICAEALRQLDHGYLNDLPAFQDRNPTSENLAKFIFEEIKSALADPSSPGYQRVRVDKVLVFESPHCSIEYSEGDR